mgnify:CR=1 FL=1|jgi:hypothetical protein
MDRRSFVRQAGLAGVGATSLASVAAPVLAQNKITWREGDSTVSRQHCASSG